ncbi:hypothetical protein H0H93_005030 [Arthromyces matolae]|nr:hypothetical protein H0H93_005030 [Arthromyces matolae]
MLTRAIVTMPQTLPRAPQSHLNKKQKRRTNKTPPKQIRRTPQLLQGTSQQARLSTTILNLRTPNLTPHPVSPTKLKARAKPTLSQIARHESSF